MKRWKAKNWLEGEIEQMESLYGNERSYAIEFIREHLQSDEYHEDLTDEQVQQVLNRIKQYQSGKGNTMDSKKNGKKNDATTETATDSKTVRISRKDAVSLLGAMGFHAAHKASNSVLTLRLRKLEKYLETFEGTLTGDQDEIKDKVLKVGKDGFDVVGEEPKGAKAKDDQPNGPKANKGVKGKGNKPTGGKKKASGEAKSKKRIDCITDVLKKLPKTGRTLNDIAKAANEDYIKAGGDDNVKQTLHHLQVILPAVVNLGFATMNDDKLVPSA